MPTNVLRNWHKLVENSDASALKFLLAENVVFYSPVVHKPQSGKALTTKYLSAALKLFAAYNFHYVKEIVGSYNAALEFVVEIDGITINGVDIISWDDSAKIVEFKVFIRPLKAVHLLHQKMAEMLQKSADN